MRLRPVLDLIRNPAHLQCQSVTLMGERKLVRLQRLPPWLAAC